MKKPITEIINLEKIVGGGQSLGTLADGRKAFVWGGLPDETVEVESSKQKSKYVEATVTKVEAASAERVEPRDPNSYLSTSPWQIMSFGSEQRHKSELIEEAFTMQNITLEGDKVIYSDGVEYGYRNKVEFSWYWNNETSQLDLAFFRRGTHGKIAVEGTSLARPEVNQLAVRIRDLLRTKDIEARPLKTLLIRCDQAGNCVFQLYVNDKEALVLTEGEFMTLKAQGGELIYSDPLSPASVITKKLQSFGNTELTDTILGLSFRYTAESFFQGNVTVYEQALKDIKEWVPEGSVVDMYSGIGSIGFTIGGDNLTLVEINKAAIQEMKYNRYNLGKKATIVETSSEAAVEYISSDATIILDPPRAGLHEAVINRLLEVKPTRIIYLSCNPVTQARDIKYLGENYAIKAHKGYNFFPRTPHIEHLVVLEKL